MGKYAVQRKNVKLLKITVIFHKLIKELLKVQKVSLLHVHEVIQVIFYGAFDIYIYI